MPGTATESEITEQDLKAMISQAEQAGGTLDDMMAREVGQSRQQDEAGAPAATAGADKAGKQDGASDQNKTGETGADGKPGQGDAGQASETAAASGQTAGDQGQSQVPPDRQAEKARKEQERRDRSWAALNAEKEQLRREREELQRIRQEIQDGRNAQRDSGDEIDPETYEQMAAEYEAEGRQDLARLARKKAEGQRKMHEVRQQDIQRREFASRWDANLTLAVEENPELKDGNSELHKTVDSLLKGRPFYRSYPEGILDAIEDARTRIAAQSASELGKLVAQQKQQIEQLNGKLSVGGGPSHSVQGQKNFDDMSVDEQGKYLQRMAQEAESRGESIF